MKKTIEDFSQFNWHQLAESFQPETRCFIDGDFVDAIDGGKFEVINPATGKVIAEVSRGTQKDIDRAVKVARRTFKSGVWSRKSPRERMNVLYRYSQLLREHTQDLALMDTLSMGRPIKDTLADIPYAALNFQYFAETIDKLEGIVTNTAANVLHYILRQPLGVVGCIVPWNYPIPMATWKIAPALAAGNTVVLKPAEQSPLSALLLAQLFIEAGGPSGVLNVIPGFGEEAGKALALNMDVDVIGFTGSVEVGKLMMIYSGQSNLKRVTTECGGKTPQIILADTQNLDIAVTAAVSGIYANQGERCNAGSRLLVERKVHDEFVERFKEKTKSAFIPGDPLDINTTMGPLVTQQQQERVNQYIKIGEQEGAKIAYRSQLKDGLEKGFYVPPTLFTNVNNQMKIAQEEIFGPVAAVIPFKDVDEAINIANDSIYGLAASIWTKDINTAHKFARDIEAGIVWVNSFGDGDMTQPWGGFKQSGFGRDQSFEALFDYTQTKSVWINLDSATKTQIIGSDNQKKDNRWH